MKKHLIIFGLLLMILGAILIISKLDNLGIISSILGLILIYVHCLILQFKK